ncbi:hypothetical protein scyTo_0012192 [Scyliorhinus torazame]|uniref:Uncharacterized protein n=1 Tax=Scyliorhinus torazame TaxID=75743 RepID=A0A401P3X2_SCYTO|nr:hypothetical protein [Scyliorhinus torazame]
MRDGEEDLRTFDRNIARMDLILRPIGQNVTTMNRGLSWALPYVYQNGYALQYRIEGVLMIIQAGYYPLLAIVGVPDQYLVMNTPRFCYITMDVQESPVWVAIENPDVPAKEQREGQGCEVKRRYREKQQPPAPDRTVPAAFRSGRGGGNTAAVMMGVTTGKRLKRIRDCATKIV